MSTLKIIESILLMTFILIIIPVIIALLPSIISYLKIKNRTSENLKKAKHIIKISILFILCSFLFIIYNFFFGSDETNTPGFVLVITGYIIIFIPMIITIPMSIKVYKSSLNHKSKSYSKD